ESAVFSVRRISGPFVEFSRFPGPALLQLQIASFLLLHRVRRCQRLSVSTVDALSVRALRIRVVVSGAAPHGSPSASSSLFEKDGITRGHCAFPAASLSIDRSPPHSLGSRIVSSPPKPPTTLSESGMHRYRSADDVSSRPLQTIAMKVRRSRCS